MSTKKASTLPAPAPIEAVPPPPPVVLPSNKQARHMRSLTEDKYVRGIDVSAMQGVVKWDQVLEDHNKITFAIVKATEGTKGVDPQAKRNLECLNALRGELVAGAYHVTHPKLAPGLTLEQDAEAEAEHFAQFCEGLALPPVVDFELNELTPERQAEWLKVHLAMLEHITKRKPMIYTYPQMLATLIHCSPWIKEYPLWLATYPQAYIRTNEAGVRIHGPALTFEQAEARTMPTIKPWPFAHGWQFSGGMAGLPGNHIKGITANYTDCNIFSTGAWASLFQ